MRTLLTSEARIAEARRVLSQYESEGVLPSGGEEALWGAAKIRDTCLHPDTGLTIPAPLRISAYVPANVIIAGGMLLPGAGLANQVPPSWPPPPDSPGLLAMGEPVLQCRPEPREPECVEPRGELLPGGHLCGGGYYLGRSGGRTHEGGRLCPPHPPGPLPPPGSGPLCCGGPQQYCQCWPGQAQRDDSGKPPSPPTPPPSRGST